VQSVTVRVPAKVNLQLAVGPRREDGYHDLVNVFHAVSVFDEVTATPATKLRITVEGEAAAAVPTDETNLAAKAARALAAVTRNGGVVPSGGRRGGAEPQADLHIKKGIPVAGGMAGGSADAAAALVACDAAWGTGLWDTREGRDTIMEIAADLGADVPFALLGGTAVGVGKGDRLSIALARGTYHWVFALADGGLSTPAVYAECDRLRGDPADVAKPMASPALMAALSAGDPVALGSALSNDLQQAAIRLRPQLRRTLDAGREHGALGAIVSGSGPTCAFLAADVEHMYDIAVALSAMGVCRAVRTATGPAPGARIVASDAATGSTRRRT
jgi:4-diphosphocytidyl-2-C-methyl-D-erythritol kinase